MTDPQVAIVMLCLFIVLVLLGFPIAFTLLAMGVSRAEASCSLRISFGHGNTEQEVDAFLDALSHEVTELRRLSSMSRS